ncbi:MAG: helix-hairpin-helix domain-containing protein [Planctomycetia bacterium]
MAKGSPDTEGFIAQQFPRRAQPVVAVALAGCLAGMAAWYVAAGGLHGGLVDHDAHPAVPLRFTVDLNTAGTVELSQLPGVGPALARRLVDHRDLHGPFRTPESLLDVPGVGEATLARLRPHLRPLPGAAPLSEPTR